ncbi:MAG: dihydroorotate dehydrogenase 2 [Nitrospinota bacterium]
MRLYESLIRPALFLLPAERSHNLAKRTLSIEFPWRLLADRFQVADPRLETEVAGLRLPSPIGLAAGLDKDVDALPGLIHLGFGSVTVGTIMPEPREGNATPRVVRLPKQMALIDHMGLPSKGLHYAVQNLKRYRASHPAGGIPPLIASVGGFSVEEVLASHRAVEPLADAVELDLTCPNVEGKGEFEAIEGIARLTERLAAQRSKPLFFRLPLRFSEENWRTALAMAEVAARFGVDGVTPAGGIPTEDPRLALGKGALAGRPVLENSLRIVRELRAAVGDRLAIRVSGGATDGESAFRLLQAGADVVNVLTAFVYRGPGAAARMNRELLQKMEEAGVKSVRELRARDPRAVAASG